MNAMLMLIHVIEMQNALTTEQLLNMNVFAMKVCQEKNIDKKVLHQLLLLGYTGNGKTCTTGRDVACNFANNCNANASCAFDLNTLKYKCQCNVGKKIITFNFRVLFF